MFSPNEQDPSNKLTKLYISALLAVALLTVASQFLIQIALKDQLTDSYIINMAGRQRMLSQKISKLSLQLERQYLSGNLRNGDLAELDSSLALWQAFHEGLKSRSPALNFENGNSEEIQYLFSGIDPYFIRIVRHVDTLRALLSVPENERQIAGEVNAILWNEKFFLNGMDQIVKQYELEARQKVNFTRMAEVVFLLLVLLVLLMEGVFVFRPAADKIREVVARLQEAGRKLRKSNRELEKKVQKRTREISEKNTQLKAVNKDLDNFVYTASHDLKAPINNLDGLISALEASVPEVHEKGGPIVDLMHESIERFKLVLADLSDTGKAKYEILGMKESVRFQEVFAEVVGGIDHLIKERQANIISDFSAAPEVKFLRKNLRSILHNLISNAVKYSSPDRKPLVKVTSKRAGDFIMLRVSDNGLGMKPEDIDKVFSMYGRIHNHVEGTGVGMSLVKKIVDGNGGKIEVRSRLDKGTVFCIFLKGV